ncbi:MAG: tetratricopeptide repeat protein [Alistipes sp.]|nr:tetratricopeptide repeat protein [Alistipes sp.]
MRFRVLTTVVIALLLCGFTTAPQEGGLPRPVKRNPLALNTEALKFLNIHGDSTRARHYAREALALDSLYAPAHYLMSRLSHNADSAVMHAQRAYKADTTNHFYLEELASALLRGEYYGKAVPLFERIVQRSTEPNHYRILAILYASADMPLKAIATLDTAEMRFGRITPLARYRQYLYLSTLQPEKAIEDAKRGIAEAPYIVNNHLALAEIYASLQRDSLAHSAFRQAIAADTTSVEAWFAYSDFQRRRNDIRGFFNSLDHLLSSPKVATANKVAQLRNLTSSRRFYRENYTALDALITRLYMRHPEDKEVDMLYTSHLIASGKVEQALVPLKRRLADEKPSAEVFSQVIDIESALGRLDSVGLYARRAVKLFPDSVVYHATLGQLALHNKEYSEASKELNMALRLATNDTLRSELRGALGDMYHQQGKSKRAYREFEHALRLWPDNAMVLNNYAYFLALAGEDLEHAYTMASRANSLVENNSTYLDTEAWVLYRLGRYEEARRYMQQALSLDRTQSAELALHYGDILDALGKEFMAQTYWRKALERGADKEEVTKRFEAQRQRKEQQKQRP